jgi:predicted nucleotidyltransferase
VVLALMTLSDELRLQLHDRREQILTIAQQFGARDVRLFGSVARGEATEESDVDFLVEMDCDRSLLDRIGLRLALADFLGREVDVVTLQNIREAWRDRVEREALWL